MQADATNDSIVAWKRFSLGVETGKDFVLREQSAASGEYCRSFTYYFCHVCGIDVIVCGGCEIQVRLC